MSYGEIKERRKETKGRVRGLFSQEFYTWKCACVRMCVSQHRRNEYLGQEVVENRLSVAQNEMVKTWDSAVILLGWEVHVLAVWSWAGYVRALSIDSSKWGWWWYNRALRTSSMISSVTDPLVAFAASPWHFWFQPKLWWMILTHTDHIPPQAFPPPFFFFAPRPLQTLVLPLDHMQGQPRGSEEAAFNQWELEASG